MKYYKVKELTLARSYRPATENRLLTGNDLCLSKTPNDPVNALERQSNNVTSLV
jgi:hypothetical protein